MVDLKLKRVHKEGSMVSIDAYTQGNPHIYI